MTQEQNPNQESGGDRQDPSEQYQTDTQTDTSDQPDAPADEEPASGEPVDAKPVEVAPSPTPTTTNIHGKDYEVTPDRGHRRV